VKFTKEVKAGLIALLAIVGFVILFQFMKGKNLFTTDDVYYVKYDNVEGLAVSNPVSINGLKVGQVDQIRPQTTRDGKIYFVVKITVDNDFRFSKNSTVEIFEPGFMSGKEIRINLAYDQPIAKDGDTLRGNFQLSMLSSISSQVGPVKDQVSSVLSKLDSALAKANSIVDDQNRREIKLLLANLNSTVETFKQASLHTNRILSSNEARVASLLDNANKTVLAANTAVGSYGRVANDIDVKKLNSTIDRLNQTSMQLNNLVEGVNGGKGSLGKLTQDEELYNNLNRTANSLNELAEDIKANPKRYLNFSVFGKVKP